MHPALEIALMILALPATWGAMLLGIRAWRLLLGDQR